MSVAPEFRFIRTGVEWLDDLLEGVPRGSRVLVSGEPGVGKSMLLTSLAASFVTSADRVLYASTEETSASVISRYLRLGGRRSGSFTALSTRDVAAIAEEARVLAPRWLVVDAASRDTDAHAIDWIAERAALEMTIFVVVLGDPSFADAAILATWADACLHVERAGDRMTVISLKKPRGWNLPRHRLCASDPWQGRLVATDVGSPT